MKSTSWKMAALTFIALLQAKGVLLATNNSGDDELSFLPYQMGFAMSHYHASEAQGKLTLSLKTNSTSTANKTTGCNIRNETISMDMQHYQVTLEKWKKYRKCKNVTLIINITDDQMYEYNEKFNVTLISGIEQKISIGPISAAVITVEDDDVIEVYFVTDDIHHVVSEGNGSYLLPLIFNSTVQEGGTAVEISVVCGSANCREDLNCTLKVSFGNPMSTNPLDNVDEGRNFSDNLKLLKVLANRTIIGTIPIFIIDDSVVEHDENFTVGISSRDSRVIISPDKNETIVIIKDNDVLSVEFRSSIVMVSEGSRTLLTLDANGTASFNYSVNISINNIQTGPEDYSFQSTTGRSVMVTFTAGSNHSSVDITVIHDFAFENMEKFTAAITSTSDPTKVLIGMQNQTTVTIENIDTFNVSFMETVYNISEDCDMYMIPILFQLPQNGTHVKITVAVNSTDITATNGRDYNYTATVTLGVTNNSSATEEILLFIEQDDILEGDESFTLELVLPSNVKVTEEKKIKVFIQDANTVSIDFTSSMGTVNESNGSFNLTLVANGTATFDYDVNISISESIESSQAKFCDHNTQSTEMKNVQFPAGCTYVTVSIQVDDEVFENNTEIFTAEIMSTSHSSVVKGGNNTAMISIIDDDIIKVYFQNASYSYLENSGTVQIPILFILPNNGSEVNVIVDVISNKENASGLTDFNFPSSVTLHPTCMSKALLNLSITIENDTTLERNEDFNFTLQARDPMNRIQIVNNSVAFTILNDDGLSVGFATTMEVVNESERTFLLRLEATATASFNYTVNITIQNNSTDFDDHNISAGMEVEVKFQAWNRTAGVVIDIDDEVYENSETFTAKISSTSDDNVEIGMNMTTYITIMDNDNITVCFQDAKNKFLENKGFVRVPVHANLPKNGSQVDVMLSVVFTNQTAINPDDYGYNVTDYTFANTSNDNATVYLHINIVDDFMVERNETFGIEVSTMQPRVKILDSMNINVTILNDDALVVGFPSSMATVNESEGKYNLIVKANRTASFDYDVNIYIQNITTNFDDYNISSMLKATFSAGLMEACVTVTDIDDEVYENDETFTAEISSTSDESVGVGMNETMDITIIDNDSITVYFEDTANAFLENEGFARVPVHANLPKNGSQVDVMLSVVFTNQTAINPDDYGYNVTEYTFANTSKDNATVYLHINIVDDFMVERNETFGIEVSTMQPRVEIVDSMNVNVTILNDDDLAVGFLSSTTMVNESEGTFMLMLEATTTTSFSYTVTITIENKSTNFDDHNVSSIMEVEFTPRNKTAGVVIGIDDEVYENNETFTAEISSTSDKNVYKGTNQTIDVTIMDNDNITIYFQEARSEVSENIGSLAIPLHVCLPTNGSQVDVTLQINITDINATDPDDYRSNMTNYKLARTSNGTATVQVFVDIVNDHMVERSETFCIEVHTPLPRVTIANCMNVSILNDDDLAVGFPLSMVRVNESEETLMLMLKANVTASFNYSVNITIQNNSTNFDDHNLSSTIEVNFPTGEKTAGVVIGIDDEVYENNETFIAEISSTSDDNVVIRMNKTIDITIMDNDNITIYFQGALTEISENIGSLAIPLHVRLPTNGSQVDVTLQINTIDLNATHLVDFKLNLTNCTLVIFNTSKNFSQIPLEIYIANETIVEFDEIFHIEVETTHRRVNILNSTSVSILNDDVMSVEFKNTSSMVVDEQEGEIIIPLKANSTSGFEFKVHLALINVTTSSSDFSIEGPLAVTFPPNTTEANITIQGINDHVYENTETFELIMTGSSYPSKIFIGGNNITTVNITDDEVVQVSFEGHPYTAKESDEQITIHLKASLPKGGSEVTFLVTVESMDESAKSEYDYQNFALQIVNFSNHSRAVQFEVVLVNNNMSEEFEHFQIGLKSISTRINITTKIAVVQIEDDDPCPCGIGGTCVYHTYNFSCDCLQDYLGTHCQIYVGEARIGISIGVGVAASIAGAIILIVTAILIVVSCWPKHTLQLKEDDQKRKAKSNNTDTTSFSKSISRNAEA